MPGADLVGAIAPTVAKITRLRMLLVLNGVLYSAPTRHAGTIRQGVTGRYFVTVLNGSSGIYIAHDGELVTHAHSRESQVEICRTTRLGGKCGRGARRRKCADRSRGNHRYRVAYRRGPEP